MAWSTCVKCGGTRFELKEHEPQGAKYKVNFVQCMSCGGVVGVLSYFNTAALLECQSKAIKAIAMTLNTYVDL